LSGFEHWDGLGLLQDRLALVFRFLFRVAIVAFIGAVVALAFAVYVLGMRAPPPMGERLGTAALMLGLAGMSVVFTAYAAGGRPVLVGPPGLRPPLFYRLIKQFRGDRDDHE
jgi:hypothetical protein